MNSKNPKLEEMLKDGWNPRKKISYTAVLNLMQKAYEAGKLETKQELSDYKQAAAAEADHADELEKELEEHPKICPACHKAILFCMQIKLTELERKE